MESSQFTDSQQHYDSLEPVDTQGATCDTFRVKLYGKLHFLKRLKSIFAYDIRYKEAFRKEFETGYRLEHPHLVRYVSLTEDGILMEYVDGETLTQRLDHQPEYFKSRKNTEKFIGQLLDVMDYLHAHQVLHLDLKPDNILLTRINDDVKLVDLGCCYTDTFTDTQGRTNRFAAPEQFAGEKPDVRTDIYAIGKILELLPTSFIYNKVIARCTAEKKDNRYNTVGELQKDISHRCIILRLCVISAVLIVFALFMLLMLPQIKSSTVEIEQKRNTDSLVLTSTMKETTFDTPPPAHDDIPPSASLATSLTPVNHTGNSLDVLKADIHKTILPKFQATMGLLSDSVKPGTLKWAEANQAFLDSLQHTLQDIILRHQGIPQETVSKEYHGYVQSLITLKYNKALQTISP